MSAAKLIEFLRAQAVAPSHEQASYARGVDGLARVQVSECGDAGAMLASSARGICRQVHRATPAAQVALRDVLARLADALAAEVETHGPPSRPPYYLER